MDRIQRGTRMKLRILMMLIIGPLLALAGFFLWLDLSEFREAIKNGEHTQSVAAEMSAVSELTHQLQKERGYSAGFVAANGTNLREDLARQRGATDQTVDRIWQSLSHIGEHDPALLSRLRDKMDRVEAQRAQVDNLSVTVAQTVTFYTDLIDTLLNTMKADTLEIEEPSVRSLARAAMLFGRAKEYAGLERAAGATGLAAEQFSHGIYGRFLGLGASQTTALDLVAIELADRQALNDLYRQSAFLQVESMRDAIAAAMAGDRIVDFGAAQWFETSTRWIDSLYEIEGDLINQIKTETKNLLQEARKKLRDELIYSISIAFVVVLLAVASFEYLIFRVKRLTRAMKQFTEGKFDVWIPGIDGRDEVGRMARAVYEFKQETLAMRRAAAEEKANDEALILGKAQRVVELVTEGLAALAQADLTQHFEDPLAPEYDAIRNDFNAATARLRNVMAAISETAVDLDERAENLMRSSRDLGTRTTEQVETIASTNERVSKLSAEVADYASHVRDASHRASLAKNTADKSGEVVRSAVDAMDRIASSSKEIGRIISIIEDITFQTNLLALNAGVEAARAGESGRGFAVVASEVRELAKRSSAATQEIKTLIDDSSTNVAEGVGLVGEAGRSLEEIFGEIAQIDDVLGQVAQGSISQADDLRDIAQEVTRLNDLANRNMDVVEASGDTSQETAQISKQMTHLVSDFRLGSGEDQRHLSARVA